MKKKIKQRLELVGVIPSTSKPERRPETTAVPTPKVYTDEQIRAFERLDREYFTFAEIATKLKCSQRHVRRMFADVKGLVPIGNEKRVPYPVYMAFILGRCVKAA